MTARQCVLAVYPMAVVAFAGFDDDKRAVFAVIAKGGPRIGSGTDHKKAWKDAASKLPQEVAR